MKEFPILLYEAIIYGLGAALHKYGGFYADLMAGDIGRGIISYLARKGVSLDEGTTAMETVKNIAATFARLGFGEMLEGELTPEGELRARWKGLSGRDAYEELYRETGDPFLSCPLYLVLEAALARHGARLKLQQVKFETREDVVESIEQIVPRSGLLAEAVGEKQKLYELLRRQQELTALNAVAEAVSRSLKLEEVLEQALGTVLELTGMEAGEVLLRDGGDTLVLRALRGLFPEALQEEIRLKVGDCIPGVAVMRGEPILSEDLQKDEHCRRLRLREAGFRSMLSLPLRAGGGKIVGALDLLSRRLRKFTTAEIKLLEIIASQIGTAVENAQLFGEIQQRAEALAQEIITEKSRHELILNSIADGVYATDTHRVVLSWNPAAERILGYKAEEVIGRSCADFIRHQDEQGKVLCEEGCPIREAIASLQPTPIKQVYGRAADGRMVPLDVIVAPLRDAQGNLSGAVEVFRDVSLQREVERAKSDFVSVVSHELRTPLSSILGFSELMLTREISGEKQRQWLEIILRESLRLSSLIDDLLDLSRIEAGRIELKREPLNLRELIQERVELAQQQSEKHVVEAKLPADLPPVPADKHRVERVLTNLLSNAIKYSPEGSRVTVSARVNPDKGEIQISVADQGIGIPQEHQHKVFERFHMVDPALTRKTGGTGLGLTVSKASVELHGGRIWVESEVGKGSTFHFTLPLTPPPELNHDRGDLGNALHQGGSPL
jgi:PAS domain S-box-containing protein